MLGSLQDAIREQGKVGGFYKGHQQEDRGRESPACGPGIYGIVVMKLMQRKNKKGTGVAGERKEGVERMGGAGGPFEAEIPPQSPGHTWVPNPVTGRGWGVLGFNT